MRYLAHSASDRTDDWPFWYVADTTRGALNVTVKLKPEMLGHQPFLCKADAIALAAEHNKET